MIENCKMRHKNGNCLPAGGFCFCDYNKEICKALQNAFDMGQHTAYEEISQFINDAVLDHVNRCRNRIYEMGEC